MPKLNRPSRPKLICYEKLYNDEDLIKKPIGLKLLFHAADLDQCTTDPCVNGQCVDTATGYTCDCMDGYTGPLCDQVQMREYNVHLTLGT